MNAYEASEKVIEDSSPSKTKSLHESLRSPNRPLVKLLVRGVKCIGLYKLAQMLAWLESSTGWYKLVKLLAWRGQSQLKYKVVKLSVLVSGNHDWCELVNILAREGASSGASL